MPLDLPHRNSTISSDALRGDVPQTRYTFGRRPGIAGSTGGRIIG